MKKLQMLFSCIVIAVLIIFGLTNLTKLTERKDAYFKYEPFYNEENNYDVLFFGSSHVINGVFPMELWDDYGIISYNFGGHGNQIPTTYWVLKNALDYTTPKLVVIDCYAVSSELKIRDGQAGIDQLHISFDDIPLSKNKIDSVFDLLSEDEHKLDFFWDFSIYHNRWDELTNIDFDTSRTTTEKGAESRINVAAPEISEEEVKDKIDGGSVGEAYLEKMITECRERNIDVLLVYLPFPAKKLYYQEANYIEDFAKAHNVKYINFLNENVVDYDTDCYDSNGHLNPSGAYKVTRYLGEFINDNYDIENKQKNSLYSQWNDDYNKYKLFKIDNINSQKALNNYLMLLYDKKFSYLLWIKNQSDKEKLQPYIKLFENMGWECSSEFVNGEENVVLVDNVNNSQVYKNDKMSFDTRFGNVEFDKSKSEMLLNENSVMSVGSDDIGIVVFDNETYEILGTSVFNLKTNSKYVAE